MGDVNNDGYFNNQDSVFLASWLANDEATVALAAEDNMFADKADVDGDGAVTGDDKTYMDNIVAGEDGYTISGNVVDPIDTCVKCPSGQYKQKPTTTRSARTAAAASIWRQHSSVRYRENCVNCVAGRYMSYTGYSWNMTGPAACTYVLTTQRHPHIRTQMGPCISVTAICLLASPRGSPHHGPQASPLNTYPPAHRAGLLGSLGHRLWNTGQPSSIRQGSPRGSPHRSPQASPLIHLPASPQATLLGSQQGFRRWCPLVSPHSIRQGSPQGSLRSSRQGNLLGSPLSSRPDSLQESHLHSLRDSRQDSRQGSRQGNLQGSQQGSLRCSRQGNLLGSPLSSQPDSLQESHLHSLGTADRTADRQPTGQPSGQPTGQPTVQPTGATFWAAH